jgi:hypothetical protein
MKHFELRAPENLSSALCDELQPLMYNRFAICTYPWKYVASQFSLWKHNSFSGWNAFFKLQMAVTFF